MENFHIRWGNCQMWEGNFIVRYMQENVQIGEGNFQTRQGNFQIGEGNFQMRWDNFQMRQGAFQIWGEPPNCNYYYSTITKVPDKISSKVTRCSLLTLLNKIPFRLIISNVKLNFLVTSHMHCKAKCLMFVDQKEFPLITDLTSSLHLTLHECR